MTDFLSLRRQLKKICSLQLDLEEEVVKDIANISWQSYQNIGIHFFLKRA